MSEITAQKRPKYSSKPYMNVFLLTITEHSDTICKKLYQNGRKPWPRITIFDPQNGPKNQMSVITAQKRPKTNQKHI